ncbi:hypothetical protein BGW80DRAFT_1179632, partial [Lactifluus volemus]
SKLPRFVQINWCGDGVPEAKKGLFHTHSSTVACFFRGTHVVISVRNEVHYFVFLRFPSFPDIILVTPSLIMSCVESTSGAKYSAHNETTRKFEPIAPAGTNHTPVGKVDLVAIRSAAGPAPPRPPVPSAPRPSAVIPAAQGSTVRTTTVGSAATAAQAPTAPGMRRSRSSLLHLRFRL